MKIGKLDCTGLDIESGHIVAVRYCWNSYVGVIRYNSTNAAYVLDMKNGAKRFRCAAQGGFHSLGEHTYQILGHSDIGHKDYSEDVFNWWKSEVGECPIEIIIYKVNID